VADIRIAISPRGAAEPGQTIEEIARERRCDPLDAVCDVIIVERGATRIVVRSMSEADVSAIAADPSALVGSDGPCVAPYDVTGQGKPHPRLYGTFPRLIGHYARDLGLLTLPQAIGWSCSTPQRSSTGRPTTTRTSIRRASDGDRQRHGGDRRRRAHRCAAGPAAPAAGSGAGVRRVSPTGIAGRSAKQGRRSV
jgi:hypothetical protein